MESNTQESQPEDKAINKTRYWIVRDIVGGGSLLMISMLALMAMYGTAAFLTKEFWLPSMYRVVNQQDQELAHEIKRKQELTRKLFGYKTDAGFQVGYADRDSNHVVTLKEAIDAWERMGIPIPGEISVDEYGRLELSFTRRDILPYSSLENLERAVQSYETEHQSQQMRK